MPLVIGVAPETLDPVMTREQYLAATADYGERFGSVQPGQFFYNHLLSPGVHGGTSYAHEASSEHHARMVPDPKEPLSISWDNLDSRKLLAAVQKAQRVRRTEVQAQLEIWDNTSEDLQEALTRLPVRWTPINMRGIGPQGFVVAAHALVLHAERGRLNVFSEPR